MALLKWTLKNCVCLESAWKVRSVIRVSLHDWSAIMKMSLNHSKNNIICCLICFFGETCQILFFAHSLFGTSRYCFVTWKWVLSALFWVILEGICHYFCYYRPQLWVPKEKKISHVSITTWDPDIQSPSLAPFTSSL